MTILYMKNAIPWGVGIVLALLVFFVGWFIYVETFQNPPVDIIEVDTVVPEDVRGDAFGEKAKEDSIRLYSIHSGDSVVSPITITGEARGYWFFEATFPVYLTDWDGRIIAEGYATAIRDWMTEDFVPFEVTLSFTTNDPFSDRGSLIFQKSNPSDLVEHDDALEIPVQIHE